MVTLGWLVNSTGWITCEMEYKFIYHHTEHQAKLIGTTNCMVFSINVSYILFIVLLIIK